MSGGVLAGRRILAVEDNFLIALELGECLREAGAVVIGPCANAADALAAIADGGIDCAVVDLNLGHGPDFAVAEALTAAGVPFALVTGYEGAAIPAQFAAAPVLLKPVTNAQVVATMAALAGG